MQIERWDNTQERRILIGMIISKEVLARFEPTWTNSRFRSNWSNLVGGWCIEYFRKYKDAPRRDIQGVYKAWVTEDKDKNTVEIVSKFIASLSDEWEVLEQESFNAEYLVDQAIQYFNEVAALNLGSFIKGDIDSGHLDKALERIKKFNSVNTEIDQDIDVFADELAMQEAFADVTSEPMIIMPNDAMVFYGDMLERDSFIAVFAPEKRGKSWTLLDFAYRAATQHRRTAYFVVGDMSRAQVLRRLYTRAARRPVKPKLVKYPKAITRDPNEKFARVGWLEREFKEHIHWTDAKTACDQVMLRAENQSYLKLRCYPSKSISAAGINDKLERLCASGWVPDVVVLDYADVLAPLDTRQERLHQIDDTWACLRGISQIFHCLLITASQTNAASMKADLMGREHFSGNKLKEAHTTAVIGLNQTAYEKSMQVSRINILFRREEDYDEAVCLYQAGCLDVANPLVLCTL